METTREGSAAFGHRGDLSTITEAIEPHGLITIHNFHESPRIITLDAGGQEARLVNLFAGEHSHAGPSGKHKIVLEEHGYRWYRVGGLSHILKREKF